MFQLPGNLAKTHFPENVECRKFFSNELYRKALPVFLLPLQYGIMLSDREDIVSLGSVSLSQERSLIISEELNLSNS